MDCAIYDGTRVKDTFRTDGGFEEKKRGDVGKQKDSNIKHMPVETESVKMCGGGVLFSCLLKLYYRMSGMSALLRPDWAGYDTS